MKNLKMSTAITAIISLVTAVCILLLFIIASDSMMTVMRKTAVDNMPASLEARSAIVGEYVDKAERLLTAYSKAPVVAQALKNPQDEEIVRAAQTYTDSYFSGLNQWEGIYIAEWSTHVLTHSNHNAIGITTREGEALKRLQDGLTAADGIYNMGILISPASQQLSLSLSCPVYDADGKKILGFVGGGQTTDTLKAVLDGLSVGGMENARYYMINTTEGTHILDEDEERMGAPVEDSMLLQVIAAIQDGNSSGNIEYTTDTGEKCIAAYQEL